MTSTPFFILLFYTIFPVLFRCAVVLFSSGVDLLFLPVLSGNAEFSPGPSNPITLSVTSLNIRSASIVTSDLDKPSVLQDFILDNSLDVLFLTETWLSPDTPTSVLNSLTPLTYSFLHQPRLTGRGGGLAVIYRSYLKISRIDALAKSSFESLCLRLALPTKTLNFLIVYRPPSSSIPTFLDEFSELLSYLCPQPADLYIFGDFNFHADDMSSSNTKLLLELLDSFECKQYVDFPTHDSGHCLDLLISRSSSRSLLSNVHPQFPALSDHYAVLATISVPTKDRPSRVTKTIRNLRSIDISSFSQDIHSSALYTAPPTNLSDYLLKFNSILASLLDKHAPTRTITCLSRTPKPFITPEIRAAKTRRSQLETIYRKIQITH